MFTIRLAEAAEYAAVRAFYHSLIRAMEGAQFHPGWKVDIYPSPEFLKDAITHRQLYVGALDGRIAACMVVNQECNEGYRNIAWPSKASPEECMFIHALGVHPDYAGHGLAKLMVQKAVAVARQAGMRAVRLDVLSGNLPAEKLYEGQGFQKVATVSLFYEDTQWTTFEAYELIL